MNRVASKHRCFYLGGKRNMLLMHERVHFRNHSPGICVNVPDQGLLAVPSNLRAILPDL